jgi:transposase-like protein
MGSIDSKFGMTPETLRIWLRRAEVAGGKRPGVTSEEKERIRQLERENRELRRANEILKAASPRPLCQVRRPKSFVFGPPYWTERDSRIPAT